MIAGRRKPRIFVKVNAGHQSAGRETISQNTPVKDRVFESLDFRGDDSKCISRLGLQECRAQ